MIILDYHFSLIIFFMLYLIRVTPRVAFIFLLFYMNRVFL